jgi:pimeloyl-ACP methyl ester carboxylesterase
MNPLAPFLLCLVAVPALAAEGEPARPVPTHGISLEGFDYPYPVRYFALETQGQELEMAYMDVAPAGATANGRTVVLLHGKNFSGAYWGETARALAAKGFRVVVPDQIGFGKSSKPARFQFTFRELADDTLALLRSLGVERAAIVGHSMGGMLATRFALLHPGAAERLVLVNPIGLEDWSAKGVPSLGVDAWFERELKQDRASIAKYQRESYYHGTWKPEYDRWVDQLAGMLGSAQYRALAWDQALAYDMIMTQPVVHEFPLLRVPTLLVIGQLDRTAVGKDRAPEAIRAQLGDYPALGRAAQRAIPGAQLVELDGVGHVPHVEAFDRVLPPVAEFLARP